MIATFSFTTLSLVCWCTSAISFSSLYSLRIVICLANIRRMSEKKTMLTTSSRLTKIAFFKSFSKNAFQWQFMKIPSHEKRYSIEYHVDIFMWFFLYNLKECAKKPTEIFKKNVIHNEFRSRTTFMKNNRRTSVRNLIWIFIKFNIT